MKQQWRVIHAAPGYEVSDIGNVRRCTNSTRGKIGDPISQALFEGYKTVQLRTKGAKQHFRVHRLVMAAFVGPSDQFINHKNGIRSDNRLKNLEYCSHQENIDHAMTTLGKRPVGSRNTNAKLTESIVVEIFRLYKAGTKQSAIANKFGVARSVVCRIIKREMWGHVAIAPH